MSCTRPVIASLLTLKCGTEQLHTQGRRLVTFSDALKNKNILLQLFVSVRRALLCFPHREHLHDKNINVIKNLYHFWIWWWIIPTLCSVIFRLFYLLTKRRCRCRTCNWRVCVDCLQATVSSSVNTVDVGQWRMVMRSASFLSGPSYCQVQIQYVHSRTFFLSWLKRVITHIDELCVLAKTCVLAIAPFLHFLEPTT